MTTLVAALPSHQLDSDSTISLSLKVDSKLQQPYSEVVVVAIFIASANYLLLGLIASSKGLAIEN